MDFIQSIIMGAVQGLSEFLPISSSGHLVFASSFYKIFQGLDVLEHSNQEIFFDIMLHVGTLVAVLFYFKREIFNILKALWIGFKTKEYSSNDFKLGIYIFIGTIITVLVAYPLNEIAGTLVFRPYLVGVLLFLTGCLLLVSEYISQKIVDKKNINIKNSIMIAIAQGIAALPGFSRSGLTISIGLLCGLDRLSASRYSFLVSIPIILGSSILYPCLKLNLQEILSFNWVSIIIGTIVSGVVGYICIKYFLKFVSKFSLSFFGYYCLIVGLFTFIFFINN